MESGGVTIRSRAKIQQYIREFIIRELLSDDTGVVLGNDDSLFRHEVIDSLSILQLLAFIDSEFDLRIETEDVNESNFDSINRLTAYVWRKLSAGSYVAAAA